MTAKLDSTATNSGLAIWCRAEVQWAGLSQTPVRAGRATLNFGGYLQQNNFNQQRLWAGGMLKSPHRQAMNVKF